MIVNKYIGIDVHQAMSVIVVLDALGKIVTQTIIETKSTAILDFLKSQRGKLHVAVEEGTFAVWLYDLIKPHVAKVVVCDPRRNKERGSKADKIDARKLAERLRTNALTPVYHEDHGTRTLKELAHGYVCLVSDCTRAKNRIKAIYRGRGIECAGQKIYDAEQREDWLNQLQNPGAQRRVERLFKQLENLEPLREQAEKEMVIESRKHPASRILGTIPGLGPIRVALIIATVITPFRFRNRRPFWAYCGLSIVTKASAEYELVGGRVRRSKKGVMTRGLNFNRNPLLKEVFKGAAKTVVRGPWKEYFENQVKRGTAPNLALLTVARKIAVITLELWKKGERYDPKRLTRANKCFRLKSESA